MKTSRAMDSARGCNFDANSFLFLTDGRVQIHVSAAAYVYIVQDTTSNFIGCLAKGVLGKFIRLNHPDEEI